MLCENCEHLFNAIGNNKSFVMCLLNKDIPGQSLMYIEKCLKFNHIDKPDPPKSRTLNQGEQPVRTEPYRNE